MFFYIYKKLILKTASLKERNKDDLRKISFRIFLVPFRFVKRVIYDLILDFVEFYLILFKKPKKEKSRRVTDIKYGLRARYAFYTGHRTLMQKIRLFIIALIVSAIFLLFFVSFLVSYKRLYGYPEVF